MKESLFNNTDVNADKYSKILVQLLKEEGYDFATGIPCGVQKHIIHNLKNDSNISHILSNSESESIGIATGAYLAGKKPVLYMQNSGLFASSNDIASLLIPYKIPALFIVTWRGALNEDAPQHKVTGLATIKLINSLGLNWILLNKRNIKGTIEKAERILNEESIPFIILIQRGWDK
jgi:phosphonopyruvate decarboxylase